MADTLYNPLDIAESSATGNPPSGFQRIQPKPDGKLYIKNSSGIETVVEAQVQTVLKLDGGMSGTTFNEYLLRLDLGANGSTFNITGTP